MEYMSLHQGAFAARSFAAQVSVIDLHLAIEDIAFFPLFHRPHQLVVDQPGGGITHSQIPLQRQAFLLQAANDRVLALSAVARDGKVGLAAQRFAKVVGAIPAHVVTIGNAYRSPEVRWSWLAAAGLSDPLHSTN